MVCLKMQYFIHMKKGKPSNNKNKIETLEIIRAEGRIICPNHIFLSGL